MGEFILDVTARRRVAVLVLSLLLVVLSLAVLLDHSDGGSPRGSAISLVSFTIPFQTPKEAKAIEELYGPHPSSLAQTNTAQTQPLPAPVVALPAAPQRSAHKRGLSSSSPVVAHVSGELKPVAHLAASQPVSSSATSNFAPLAWTTGAKATGATAPADQSLGKAPALESLPSKSLVRRADADVKQLALQNIQYRTKIAQLKEEVAELAASKKADSARKGTTSAAASAGQDVQHLLKHDQADITRLTGEVRRLKLIDDGQYGILYRRLQNVDTKLKSMQRAEHPEQKAVLQQLPSLPMQQTQLQALAWGGADVRSGDARGAAAQPTEERKAGARLDQLDFNPERLLAGYKLAGGEHPGEHLEEAREAYLSASRESEPSAGTEGALRAERSTISDKLLHMAQHRPQPTSSEHEETGSEDEEGRPGSREGEDGWRGEDQDGWHERRRDQERRERSELEGAEVPRWERERGRTAAADGRSEDWRARRDKDEREGEESGSWGNLNSRAARGFEQAAAAAEGGGGPYAKAMTGKVFQHFMREESSGEEANEQRRKAKREEERRDWQRKRLQADESGAWDDGPNR